MTEDIIPKVCYEEERIINMKADSTRNWVRYTKSLLIELGLDVYWNTQLINETDDRWGIIVRDKIIDRRTKMWNLTRHEKRKLRTYNKIKKEWGESKYLTMIKDSQARRFLARLRSSTSSVTSTSSTYVKCAAV